MNTKHIDFYIVDETMAANKFEVCCQLTENAYTKGHKIFIYCQNQEEAHLLDELLWTYKDDSFIPHHLVGENLTPPPPIQIGYAEQLGKHYDILINCALSVPEFYTKFRRVIEIVENDENAKLISREHYKYYQQQKCQLRAHKLSPEQAA